MSPRRTQHANLNAMFQLNSWIPLVGDSSKLAVRNIKTEQPLRNNSEIYSLSGPEDPKSSSISKVHYRRGMQAFDIQPLEPMLLPKVRICFADFPWSHCSMDQRLFTSESGCGCRYGPFVREEVDLRQGFHEDNQGSERR